MKQVSTCMAHSPQPVAVPGTQTIETSTVKAVQNQTIDPFISDSH
jgi:hypothetical protein